MAPTRLPLSQRCRIHAEKMQDEGWYVTANVLDAAATAIEKDEAPARPTMTPSEFRAAKEALGCSWARLALALGYSDGAHCRAIGRGDTPVTPTVAVLLTILLRLPAARKIAGL